MSFDEFIEWTQTFEGQQGKYEWYKGEIFDVHAMVGAHSDHNRIALNVAAALHAHLAGTRCEAFVADMMLRVEADDVSYFPDVMVTCSEADRSRDLVKTDAVLVVEVISPSTEAYDRGKKFASYRKLVSLQELVFIDPEGRRIDHFRRATSSVDSVDAAPDTWVVLPADGPLALSAVDLSMTRDQVFAGVTGATTGDPASARPYCCGDATLAYQLFVKSNIALGLDAGLSKHRLLNKFRRCPDKTVITAKS